MKRSLRMTAKPPWILAAALVGATVLGVCARDALARGDLVPGSRYTSARAAAMGDAFLPLADDGASGLFYNPAGLGKIRGPIVEPLNFQIQANTDYINSFGVNFYKVTSLSSYASTLAQNSGENHSVSASLVPNFATRGIAVGLLINTDLSADENAGNIHYKSRYQVIPAVGGALRLASGVVRMGYSLQWVNQASGENTVASTSTPLGYNQSIASGSAFSNTLGFALTLPVSYLPSFNAVARNVLTAKFKDSTIIPLASNRTGTPADEPMTIDASFSVSPKVGRGGYFNLVLEYRDITATSGMSLFGRLASGIEFSFRDQFFLRGGFGSGYPSAGIGLKRKAAEFALTWYSEELGTSYHAQKNTKFQLHYQIRAF